jgi:hypothetical protein
MPRYSDEAYDEAYDDARDEEDSENRECAIDSCQEHMEGFAWRWRIVESANAKIPSLRITDPKKAKSLARRIKHLEKWCESAIEDELIEMADGASEAKDPYAYRGLSRSDF